MKNILIHHHVQGMLFYDKNKKRRYFVTKQNVTINTVPIEEPIEYFYDLSEEAYFQQSIMRDDLDELIYMAKTYIDGIQIMEIRVVNNNPMNFKALINGSLELSIHYEDGVRAMPGLPNVELLNQYWKDGVLPNAGDNEAKVREILMSIQKVNAKKRKPHNGAT